MKQYQYYTFSLWDTLIKMNPSFIDSFNNLIFNEYNPENFSNKYVLNLIGEINRDSMIISQKSGIYINSKIKLAQILDRLEFGDDWDNVWQRIEELDNKIQELFLQNLPTLYDENTWKTLESIRYFSKKMAIISNNNYVHGKTINKALNNLKIDKFFDAKIHSDEYGFSKPHLRIFNKAYNDLFPRQHDIIHVGNDEFEDGACKFLKWEFFQINSDKSISELLP